MAQRFVITGLPCSPEVWKRWLGSPSDTRVLSLKEVLDNSKGADLRKLSRYVAQEIEAAQPTSILAHDFGVALTLMALLRLERKGTCPRASLTLFNGAFRPLDPFKASHPFRFQYTRFSKMVKEAEGAGGAWDPDLKRYVPRIRAMYRFVIYASLMDKMESLLGLGDVIEFSGKLLSRVPVQIIASPNDPYIPYESVTQLKHDFFTRRFIEIPYGHFPYTVASREILPYVEEFEKQSA